MLTNQLQWNSNSLTVLCFASLIVAQKFTELLSNKFGLSVAADKTRMMRFNRFHPSRQRSFQFLGFEFYWDVERGSHSSTESDETSNTSVSVLVLYMSEWIIEEPSAVIPLTWICAEAVQVTGLSTTTMY